LGVGSWELGCRPPNAAANFAEGTGARRFRKRMRRIWTSNAEHQRLTPQESFTRERIADDSRLRAGRCGLIFPAMKVETLLPALRRIVRQEGAETLPMADALRILDAAAAEPALEGDAHFRHYLLKRSYAKALAFLETGVREQHGQA
jgi:hypothetical protein